MRNGPNEISQKRGRFAVSLLKFNQLRGRLPEGVVSIVEGEDDPLFYSSIYSRIGVENPDVFFVANGKDNVLALREHLAKSLEAPRGGFNTFFVDKDFDGTKGKVGGSDLYVTPTYSFENLLICPIAVRALLVSDFRLGTAECVGDIKRVLEKFEKLIADHAKELEEVNSLLYWIRKKESSGIRVLQTSIDPNEPKYATLRSNDLSVKKQASRAELASLLKLNVDLEDVVLAETSAEFKLLVPKRDWRGKFIFHLLCKFISVLVEDRNCQISIHFSQGKGKVSLDTSGRGLIRALALACEIPVCLKEFARARARDIDEWRNLAVAA